MSAVNHERSVILVTEDEALVRMLAVDVLTEEGGFRTIEAVDADEALELLEARPDVRVLVTDVDMPGSLNGFGLARVAHMRWPGLGIIATSGCAAPGPGDMPEKARFIPKPYSPSTLLLAVREILGEQSAPILIPKVQGILPTTPVVPGPALDLGGLAQPLLKPVEA